MSNKIAFHLPRDNYPTLVKVIKAYFTCGEKSISPSALYEMSLGKITNTSISGTSKFLKEIGVIELDKKVKSIQHRKKYRMTPIGRRLGNALANDDRIEITKAWRQIVKKYPFFDQILRTLEISGPVDKSKLKEYIIQISNSPRTTRRFDSSAAAILTIMEKADLVEVSYSSVSIKREDPKKVFVNEDIIDAIESADSIFDCSRLVCYCREINDNYRRDNYASVGFLSRAVCDHIPPIFEKKNFTELATQTPGERHESFKKSCRSLDSSLKNIVDRSIHKQIDSADIPPFEEEINFSQDLNTILARVVEQLNNKWVKK